MGECYMPNSARLEEALERTAWMADARFGVMAHWLPETKPMKGHPLTDWNEAVEAFDIEGFLQQFKHAGAGYLLFTLGQNSGFYCSPNEAFDATLPGRCSRFDLAGAIADRITASGARFMAYLPTEMDSSKDMDLRNAFGWDAHPYDKSIFHEKYQRVIQCWAERFGKKLSGWWFDGCYDQHSWTSTDEWSNERFDYRKWVACAKAGNHDALVAFNNGVGSFLPICASQDYTAGEANDLSYLPSGRMNSYTQWHALTYLDCFWGHTEQVGAIEPPRFSDEELFAYVKKCREKKGAVTLNVGIYQSGLMADKTIEQLNRLSRYLELQ
jgi:hypothetical protein